MKSRTLLASALLMPIITASVVPLLPIEVPVRRSLYTDEEYAYLSPRRSAPLIDDSPSGLFARMQGSSDKQSTSKDVYNDLEMGLATKHNTEKPPSGRGSTETKDIVGKANLERKSNLGRSASLGQKGSLRRKGSLGRKDSKGRKDSDTSGTSGNTVDSRQPLLGKHSPSLLDLPQHNLQVKTQLEDPKSLGQKTPAFQTPPSKLENGPDSPLFEFPSMYNTAAASFQRSAHNSPSNSRDRSPHEGQPDTNNNLLRNPLYSLRQVSSTAGSQPKSSGRQRTSLQHQSSTGRTGRSTPKPGNTFGGGGGGPQRLSGLNSADLSNLVGQQYSPHHNEEHQSHQHSGNQSPHNIDPNSIPELPPKSIVQKSKDFVLDHAQQMTGWGFATGNAVAAIGTGVGNQWIGAAGPAINAATSLGVVAIGMQNDARKQELRKHLEAEGYRARQYHSAPNSPQSSHRHQNQRRSLRLEARDLVHLLMRKTVKARTVLDKRIKLNKLRARGVRRGTIIF